MLGFSYNHLDNNYGVPPVDELVRIDLKQNRYDAKAEFYEPFSWVGDSGVYMGIRLSITLTIPPIAPLP
jgi:hypothetical protein